MRFSARNRMLLVAMCVAGSIFADPGAWLKADLPSQSSDKWRTIKESADAAIGYLERDSAAGRQGKIRSAATMVRTTEPDAEDTYRAARIYLSFPEDTKAVAMTSAILTACANTAGAAEPEFARVVYLALTKARSGLKWPGLGGKLISLFPDDQRLRDALIFDAVDGNASYDDCLQALSFCDAEDTSDRTSLTYLYRVANIRMRMYFIKNQKSDLETSISAYKRAIAIDKDRQRITGAASILRILERRLRDGSYVGG